MEDLSSNSLSDFADDWVMDQPAEEGTDVDQSLPGGETFPAGDIAGGAIVVAEEVFGDGDKAAGEVAEGELKEVVVVEEAVPKRRRRRAGKRKMVEKSDVPPSPSEVLQRRSRRRQRRAGSAEVSPPFGTVKGRLTAYTLTVNIGEDVVSQILSFSKFGPQAICTILSATGIVSSVTISQPSHPSELASFEGRFEIISLSGSFSAGEIIGGPEDGGMLNILLGNSNGVVFGGGLAGSLIAASPIQLVCGSLEKQTHQEPKRRRGAKSSVAASMPGNSKAERVLTTMTETADGDKNFMTLASAVSELTNGAGDATFVGQSMILNSLDGINENTSQSSWPILDQRTSTNS